MDRRAAGADDGMPMSDDPIKTARSAVETALAERGGVDLSWIVPAPSASGWTLAADALKFVGALVKRLRPGHVIELGAGLSTRALARSCREAGLSCAISSVDHDPEFGAVPPEAQGEGGPAVRLLHQLAPVVARDYGGKLLPVYRLDAGRFASRSPADLALIDGPPITLGGREGTLYQLMDHLRPGSVVLLDDADRGSERRAVSHWRDNLGEDIEVLRPKGFSKGMAVILVHQVVPSETLWQRKLHITRLEIERVVPAGSRFVLVDEDYWGTPWPEARKAVSFVERDGQSWGPPVDDASALEELRRSRREGCTHLVFLWPAFWWMDYYTTLMSHLRSNLKCVLENDRVTIFDLKAMGAAR